MIGYAIDLVENATEADAHALSHGIITFNRSILPTLERIDEAKAFHVFVRNDSRNVTGGLRASCYWNTLHIALLWLGEDLRGQGMGRRLLEIAERYATDVGCELAHVETTSWQALPFYEKCGYVLMGTLEGRPVGHATHYLTKRL